MGHGKTCLWAYGNDSAERGMMSQDRGNKERGRQVCIDLEAGSGELTLVRVGMHFVL